MKYRNLSYFEKVLFLEHSVSRLVKTCRMFKSENEELKKLIGILNTELLNERKPKVKNKKRKIK